MEDDGTGVLFVAVRGSRVGIALDAGCRRRRPGGSKLRGGEAAGEAGALAREIEEKARIHGRRSRSPRFMLEFFV